MSSARAVARADLVRHRFHVHGLDQEPGSRRAASGIAVLDLGVQVTGPDGARLALLARGARPSVADDLVVAWTLRGAPHAYRRADVAAVSTATAPLSEADAAKRVLDASKPLREAGVPVLEALGDIARHMRAIVTKPTAKGDVSSKLASAMGKPYLRYCRVCGATHLFEMPFRLAALQAGLELDRGTSPPVLRRIPGHRPALYQRSGADASPRFDVIRGCLRFAPASTEHDVAAILDAPVKDVRAAWPEDAVEVGVTGAPGPARRFALADDDLSGGPTTPEPAVRLLGPYDPYLQLRDRELLVADAAHRKDLWRALGRPGAVARDGEIVGTWRPRTARGKLTVLVDRWTRWDDATVGAVAAQAELLADLRAVELGAVTRT